ncbi:MAG: hypothetical protein MRY32_02475 [Rickettsiales bacterium]|nr:hypothetical protein [Rickettsiales bacterium]
MQVGRADYNSMNSILAVSFADKDISSAAEQIRLSRERSAREANLNLDEAVRKSNQADKQVHAQQRLAQDANDLLNQARITQAPPTPAKPESLGAFLPPQLGLSPSAQAAIFGNKELLDDASLTPQAQRRARLSQTDIREILGRVQPQQYESTEVEELPEYDFDLDAEGNIIEPVRQRVNQDDGGSPQPSAFSPIDTLPDTLTARAAGIYTANYYNFTGDAPRYSFLG